MQNRIVNKGFVFAIMFILLCVNISSGIFINYKQLFVSKSSNEITNIMFLYPPEEEWNRTYGGNNLDSAHSILQTPDGGFVILGYTLSFGDGGDVWLIKTDSEGYEEWNKTFDGIGYHDGGRDILKTSDGGYIIPGFITNMAGPPKDEIMDAWLIKLDSNFNEEWNKTYGGNDYESFSSIQQLDDDGYIILGENSYESGKVDIWIIKTDEDGIEQWNKTYGNYRSAQGKSLLLTSDGGFIIIGKKQKNIEPYDVDIWLLKFDENGNMLWNKTFGGSNWDWGNSILEANDSGYFLVGCSGPFQESNDIWLIKTDYNGTEQWNKTFGGVDDDVGESIIQTIDGEYLIIGYTDSFGSGGYDGWLIKIDGNGNEIWNKTCGGTNTEYAESIIQTMDGDYVIAGTTLSLGASYLDAWLLKLSYSVSPKKVYVDDDFNENTTGWGYNHFNKIQEGIDAVNENGTVFVYNGTYYENIVIVKSIYLIGENRNTTVIDGGDKGDVVKLTADGVTVTGFTIRNGGSTFSYAGGILLDTSSNSIISDNIIIDNGLYGIWVLENESSYTTISNNIISGNGEEGRGGLNIWLYQSSHNTISGNIIEKGKGYGLAICYWSTHTTVTGNIIVDNRLEGIKSRYCYDNKIYKNTIKNNSYFGIRILNASANNIIEHNNFIDNEPKNVFFTITDFSQSNQWNGNYWSRPRLFPKLILGCIKNDFIGIPWVNFDWHPAKGPYDI